MNRGLRHLSVMSRPAIAAAVGFLPFGSTAALSQEAPRPPREVPYLNYPPGINVPGVPAAPTSPAPSAPPVAAVSAPPTPDPQGNLDALKKRELELAGIRAEQKKAL